MFLSLSNLSPLVQWYYYIIDGKLEYVAHALRKIGLSWEKKESDL